ncbi:hypothetical protein ACQPWW_16080 [Micromonospora sp. CA-240977]
MGRDIGAKVDRKYYRWQVNSARKAICKECKKAVRSGRLDLTGG